MSIIIGQFMIIIILISGMAIPLFIIVQSFLNFSRAKDDHLFIVLKAVGFLFLWLLVSSVMFYVLFIIFYSAAHAANPEDADIPAAKSLTLFGGVYILIGVGLIFFIGRVPKRKAKISNSGAT